MKVAIVGATGLVGESLVEIVCNNMPKAKLTLYANKSVGKTVEVGARKYKVLAVEKILENLPDVAMFVATNEVSRQFVPKLANLGVVCIDNSSEFRLQTDVPLVVPCVNGDTVYNQKVIANPNCTTIQVAVAVNCLKSLSPYKMTVATYQAVSGAGREGLTDLQEKREYGKLKSFAHPIYDNVIAQIGQVTSNGYTTEEIKMQRESEKILGMNIAVNCLCARVPVTVGHSAFVNLQFEKPFTMPKIRQLLAKEPNVLTFFDQQGANYPMPRGIRGSKYVGVGRVFRDGTSNGINMFVVADNLLRGASYNAFEILQLVERRYDFE